MKTEDTLPKYRVIRQHLSDAIASGEYQSGQRLPSESQLVRTFSASRPTVNRALRDLQLTGVIERRAGSGSYVPTDAATRGYTFGLLIPELGRTEIFEPICRGMAETQNGGHHVIVPVLDLGTTRSRDAIKLLYFNSSFGSAFSFATRQFSV